MSASWQRVLGLMVVSASLVAGCGSAKKIDAGGACVLNSDCNQGLVCTWGKCHVACHTSADCQPGQSCITTSAQSTVCESPATCIYNSDCPTGLICAVDQQCRKQCQTSVDCTSGQICTSTKTCAELSQVDSSNNLFLPDGGVSGSGGTSGADGAGSCPVGAETCLCYGNDTCNAGLTCASHLCVSLGAGGSGGGGSGDAGVRDAPGAQPDVSTGGTGGGGTSASSGGGGGAGVPCENQGTVTCLENWAEWPMPNSQVDVAAGAPNPQSFTDNGDGTVTDNVTGLMWQQAVGPAATYTWAQAVAYCPTLTLAGHSDWRLPALIELFSIADVGLFRPCLDSIYFSIPQGIPNIYFWSSSPYNGPDNGSPSSALCVDFYNCGPTFSDVSNNTFHARCVR